MTAEGKGSLGYTFTTTTGYSEIHVSPYAATHRSTAIFRASVGHELTWNDIRIQCNCQIYTISAL
jgi:hypothetical protein